MKAVVVSLILVFILALAPRAEAQSAETEKAAQTTLNPVDCALAWFNYFQCVLQYGTLAGYYCQDELETARQCDWSLRRRSAQTISE